MPYTFRAVRSVLVTLAAATAVLACESREITIRGTIDGGAAGGSAGMTAGAGGAGGAAGMGGGMGGMAAGGAAGGGMGGGGQCVRTGSAEVCNGKDDDCNGTVDDVDPATLNTSDNCGKCFNLCEPKSNTTAACTNSACAVTCLPGYVDLDKSMINGCECPLYGAEHDVEKNKPEICDGRDNDCDGVTDEGYDKKGDVKHCGGCNRVCNIPNAVNLCDNGECKMGNCLPGFFNRNNDANDGCEVACAATNGGVEICDGIDNDCDGMVDEGVVPSIQCRAMGVCAGVTPVCMGATGWVCNYPATFQDAEDMAKGCDDLDNDCDGRTDEPFGVGTDCSAGIGACANAGKVVCDTADRTKTKCNAVAKAAGTEICNGKDDDCDGKTDELAAGDRTSDDALVFLANLNLTMFVHEASRFDSTMTSAGADSSQRPCSVPNRLPWSNVTKEEPQAACKRLGATWRLCTATEWEDACNGAANTVFPYGNAYDADTCNGADFRLPETPAVIATGVAGMCVSDLGGGATNKLLDMSGNVKEWVLTSPPNAGTLTYALRGGAYNTAGFTEGNVMTAPGLQCNATAPAPTVDVRLPSVGFRCCKDGPL